MWRRSDKAVLGIFLFAGLLYANTVSRELVYDDRVMIPERSVLRNPWDTGAFLRGLYWGEVQDKDVLYRPFTLWTLALNYRLNQALGLPGEHPVGYHVVNVLLHAAVCCLLWRFFRACGLPSWVSLASALLFAAHPIHTEAVALIVNRSELLAALFGFAVLIFQRWNRWWGALLLLPALLSKESAVVFLPLAVCVDVWLRDGERTKRILFYAGCALGLFAWLGLRAAAIGDRPLVFFVGDNPLLEASVLQRVLTAACLQVEYLRLLLVPVGLSSNYAFNQIPVVSDPLDLRFVIFAGLLIGAAGLGVRWRRRHPVVLFSVVGYAVAFAPTSNFLLPIGTMMAERLAYTPSAFFCLLAGYGTGVLRDWMWRPALIVLGTVLVVYGGLTVARNRTWTTEAAFYEAMIHSAPNSARANHMVGKYLHVQGNTVEAMRLYRRAVEIQWALPDAWNDLGTVYEEQGDMESAIACYRRALEVKPDHATASYNLAQVFEQQGDLKQAVEHYQAAIRTAPEYVEAYNNLGAIYARAGRPEEAEALWKKALEIRPKYEIARKNLEMLRHSRR